MREWTWQWLVLLGVVYLTFSAVQWITYVPYDTEPWATHDIYDPRDKWKGMVWDV